MAELAEVVKGLVTAVDAALAEGEGGHGGQRKADGSVVTATDTAIQERVRAVLAEGWPEYDFLGEEMDAESQWRALSAADGLWCLDPLDGTSNYAAGVPYYAVSLALLVEGAAELGVVYDPVRRECFTARRGEGAWLNDRPLAGPARSVRLEGAVAMVDFKRLDRDMAMRLTAQPPYHSQRNFGAVALDWCWLAAGRGDLYLHGGQFLWDYAAAELVFREAGGAATTLQGEPVASGHLGRRSVVAALDPDLFEQWRTWLGVPDAEGGEA